ncbi:MAG: Ycf66 family protein [Synechococcaceae cyanobacterium]
MLAVLGGALALVLGLAILLLPLLLPELSRSRDAVWGAVVLLLGLVLVTSAERLTGAPMLGVLCGGLLIGRLAVEVGQGRWRQLTAEEQGRLGSAERWRKALGEAGSASAGLLALASQWSATAGLWLRQRRQPRSTGKRWIRPEQPTPEPSPTDAPDSGATPETLAPASGEATGEAVVVSSFAEIDAMIEAGEDETREAEAGHQPAIAPADDGAGSDDDASTSAPSRTG